MRLQESHGGSTPQSPSPSPKEFECAIKECVDGDRGRVREMIGMARLGEYGTFMLMRTGIAALLESRGLPRRRICQVVAVDGHRLKHLMELNEVLEFRLISEFKPKTVFDAYWMYTSLVTLKLPFIIKSKFNPHNDVCGAFKNEGLCHRFIAGFILAESWKSAKPYRRFKQMDTTHPATVATILSIANHLAMRQIMTKVYIGERWREVYFILSDLPRDVERFVKDVWGDPTTLTKLTDEEFLSFLAGLIAGDGSISWGDVVEVVIAGNLEREEPLYVVVQGELKRRLGIEASLRERKNLNTIVLRIQYYDTVRLLRILPPLIEPLKELKRQVLLNKDRLGVRLAKRLFGLLGDRKKNGEKGIHGLQSYQAIRFLTTLTRLGLIRLKPEEGHYILETPTNPHGRALKTTKTTPGTGTRTQDLPIMNST